MYVFTQITSCLDLDNKNTLEHDILALVGPFTDENSFIEWRGAWPTGISGSFYLVTESWNVNWIFADRAPPFGEGIYVCEIEGKSNLRPHIKGLSFFGPVGNIRAAENVSQARELLGFQKPTLYVRLSKGGMIEILTPLQMETKLLMLAQLRSLTPQPSED